MALDFNQISARLTRLPDDALSAFARQHMSNYSIMSLVANELSRRKGIRDAAALKMAGTPPPVNEQLVASLSSGQAPTQGGAGGTGPAALPENQGLGLLPIKTAYGAEGGIVGYADEGLVRSGLPGSSVDITGLLDDARLRRQTGPYGATEPVVSVSRPTAEEPTEGSWLMRGLRRIAKEISPPEDPRAAMRGRRSDAESASERLTQRVADEERAARQIPIAYAPPTPVSAPPNVAPRTAAGIAQLAPQQTRPAQTVDPRQQAMEDAKYFFGNLPPRDTEAGIRKLEEIDARSTAAREKARAEYLASLPKDQIGAAAETRYKKEAEAEPARRKDAFYMAMFEAGLGMMASSSPHAFQGIAEGAMKGVGSYKNAMKELDSLARSRNEALDAIDNARRAEKMGRAKEAHDYAQTAASNADKFAKEMFSYVQNRKDLDYQDKLNIAKAIYADFNADTRLDKESRNRKEIALIQAAARFSPAEGLDARILAADRAGNTAEVARLIDLKRNMSGRGALTPDQINDNIAKFLSDPMIKMEADRNPKYRQAVIDAARAGQYPPAPGAVDVDMSAITRVNPKQ